jgi:uncharacterized protein YcbK (DUF882 family)
MLQFSELLSGNSLHDVPQEHQDNLHVLLDKINQIRLKYGIAMTVSSGYRTMAHHLAIYAAKGITDHAKIPMKSKHLYGEAVDISDHDGALKTWCRENEDFLRSVGVWMESFDTTTTWCHFQVVPYGSFKVGGSLWFIP